MENTRPALSRRNILIGAAGAAVAAIVASSLLRPLAGERTRRLLAGNPLTRRFLSLADGSIDEWRAQVGSVFTAAGGRALRLAGIRPLPSGGARPPEVARRRAFLAVFDVAGGVGLPGDVIHMVTHPDHGRIPLFLTVSDQAGRMHAVFN